VSSASQKANPPLPPGSPLQRFWTRPVSDLVELTPDPLPPEQQQRHRIFVLMLMALIHIYWNPHKKGLGGDYPNNPDMPDDFSYEYKGHNIAAIAVDGRGRVIDFDFNHNKLFHSSAEHAEARLVRRVFSLAQISDRYSGMKTGGARGSEYETLSEVTIYTSLESCAQCAGMMALGNVKEVVYLQQDPGMYRIGNILYQLNRGLPQAPRPRRAGEIDLDRYSDDLDDGFQRYVADMDSERGDPFWIPPPNSGKADDWGQAISSYLCTTHAFEIYERGRDEFEALVQQRTSVSSSWRGLDRDGNAVPDGLTNTEAVEEAQKFLEYAKGPGRRGTPHGA